MRSHYDPQLPLENDSREHFWDQIDLWPKKYVKVGLEEVKKELKKWEKPNLQTLLSHFQSRKRL